MKAVLEGEPDHKIIEDGHDMPSIPDSQAGDIFLQSDISAIVQSTFDPPILAH